MILTIIIIIIILLLLSIILFNKFNGGLIHGYYHTFDEKMNNLINMSNDEVSEIYDSYFNMSSIDVKFKYYFCKIGYISGYLYRSDKIKKYHVIYPNPECFIEIDKKDNSCIYNNCFNIVNKFGETKHDYLIYLEANENFKSHHWMKSLMSDFKNICSILKNIQSNNNILNKNYCSFQLNYNNGYIKSPFHSGCPIKENITLKYCNKLLFVRLTNMFKRVLQYNRPGTYRIVFSNFIDENSNLLLDNKSYNDILEIDLTNLKTYEDLKQVFINLIDKYTTVYSNECYCLENDTYTKYFNNICDTFDLKQCYTKIGNNEPIRKIEELTKTKKLDLNGALESFENNKHKKCVHPDGYIFI